MSNVEIGFLIGLVANALGVGLSYGALRNQVKNMPAIINGTAIRPHEERCNNYVPHRTDHTNPNVRIAL